MAKTEETPTITLNPLIRSDGSAQWQFRRTNVIAGVNGPMDPARIRDELPSEACIEVVVRPAVGVTSLLLLSPDLCFLLDGRDTDGM